MDFDDGSAVIDGSKIYAYRSLDTKAYLRE
jgi:hypothetical protein